MPETKILIIGGGAAGLSMGGALKKYGLDAVILDAGAKTGDVWRNRYERLHLHTVKGLSYSAHKKFPGDYPRYIPKDKVADYLSDYAGEFDLDIRHNCKVTRISKGDSGFIVETEDGETWHCEQCIVATGINRTPFIPDWKGVEDYQGKFTHAVHHKTGKDYAGQRVLVVGIGNTGAEVCADCVEGGATKVDNSIRTFPTVVARNPLGIPIHIWGVFMAMLPVPAGVKDWFVKMVSWITLGDLTKYGLKKPEWFVFKDSHIPMIDVGYVPLLKKGKITIKPDIAHFTQTGVQFTDDSHEDYDAVIVATGYRTGLGDILDIPDVIDEDGNVIAENGANAPHPGLWFIGLMESPAGILMVARIQATRFAKAIAQNYGKGT